MRRDDQLNLTPIESYEAPRIPTLANKPKLAKLPSRWKKNAAVVACVGIVGSMTLAGCATAPPHNGYWFHNGGGPVAPYYVVYLTEQEALGHVRAQLEAAGLNFDAKPPSYSITSGNRAIGLDLFDEEKGVAIAVLGERVGAEWAAQEFAQQTDDITFGVFYSPQSWFWNAGEEERERIAVEDGLADQVRTFIEFLQSEDIL